MIQPKSVPTEIVSAVQADPLRWRVVRDGLKLFAYSASAIGAGVCLILLSAMLPISFPSLGFISLPILIVGTLIAVAGGLAAIVAILHCCATPEPITRALAILVVVITIYSAHQSYSVQRSMTRNARLFQDSRSSRPSFMRNDNAISEDTEIFVKSVHEGNRAGLVLGIFSNAVFLTFLMALMCYFRQDRIVRSLQKVFVIQIASVLVVGLLVTLFLYVNNLFDMGSDSILAVFGIGILWISMVILAMYLTVRNTLLSAKVIDGVIGSRPAETLGA